nr:sugar transferase [Dokdonella sp.]
MLRFLREQGARWLLLLAVLELCTLIGSLLLAMQLRYLYQPEDLIAFSVWLELRATVFAAVIVASMAALGMYQPNLRENWLGMLARQGIGFAGGGAAVALVFYLIPQLYIGRTVIGIALAISFPLVAVGRWFYLRVIDIHALKRRVMVLGSGSRAEMIITRMRRRVDRRGFFVVGFLPLPGEASVVPDELLLEQGGTFRELVQRLQINEIVIAAEDRRGQLPMKDLLECKQHGTTITNLITFFEREQGRVTMNLIDPSWLIFSDGFDASPMRRISKRIFDLTSAAFVLALTWPLMLLTALAIALESGFRGPILYRQERVGERGKTFRLIKFRSMRTDAEKDGVARWASLKDDRVTR